MPRKRRRNNSSAAKKAAPSKKPRPFSEEKIRVGRDYQSQIPAYIHVSERKPEEQCFERALLVWSPASGTISDQKCKCSEFSWSIPKFQVFFFYILCGLICDPDMIQGLNI
jgi:ELM2 domain